MALVRKIALALVLVATAAVLISAGVLFYLHFGEPSGADTSVQALEERVDLLNRHVRDMELLVLVLLGTSGLYAIVFVASSYFSSISFARQADQTIGNIQDQIGLAMGDLRELQEDTEQRLRQMTATPVASAPLAAAATAWETQLAEIVARIGAMTDRPSGEHARMELIRDEHAAAHIENMADERAAGALAELYLSFGRIYASSDAPRSRFYLERAVRLAAPESPVASEIRYQLALGFAQSHDFAPAMRELAAAFEHQFKTLEEKLAGDIEEGGKLYELASTAPFDKAVNDLLLNMSIGIG
jgi:hypothetical protein